MAAPRVEVRRSARRRRTVSARREGDVLVVLLPAGMAPDEEARWIAEMTRRVERGEARRRRGTGSDEALLARCRALGRSVLPGVPAPREVRWVPPMRSRWASCTRSTGTVRVSERLRGVPPWVLDYVLVHELAHLVEPGHGPAFWALVQRYPRTERAIGYLEGVSAAAGLGIVGTDGPDDGPQGDDPADGAGPG